MTPPAERAVPKTVWLLTAGLALVGVAGGGLSLAFVDLPDTASWWLAGWLVVTLAAAGLGQLEFRYRDDVESLDLFEAALMPVLFVFAGPAAVVMAAAGKAISEGVQRVAVVKSAFNVAQWMAATSIGTLIYLGLRPSDPSDLTVPHLGAMVIALAGVSLVNHGATVLVLRLVQTRSLADVVRDHVGILPLWGLGGAVNVSFGILFAVLVAHLPAATPVVLLPLAALHWAHRGYAEGRADRARLHGLQRATHELAAAVDPRDALGPFLRRVRDCFEAEAVDLLLNGSDDAVLHRLHGDDVELTEPGPLVKELMARDETMLVDHRSSTYRELADRLAIEGWRDCLAAPVRSAGRTIGVLVTYSRSGLEGFEEGSLAVLDALAAEVANAVARGALLDAILEERRKFAEIVNTTSDGIATVAADGRVLSWNPGLTAITGFTAKEMDGAGRLRMLRPRDSDGNDVVLERWVLDDVMPPSEVQVLTRDGDEKWLSCSYTKVADPDDAAGLLIVMARDVTSAHELEKLKSDFVSIVSHELRTPLAPIMGWARSLLKNSDKFDEGQKQSGLESILRQAQRLEALILNILEVSRIEVGANQPRDDIVEVPAAIGAVVGELLESWPGREVRVSTPDEVRAHGSQLWIEQIVTNLLSNALKYSPASEPIEVSVTQQAGAVYVAVADRGPGISPRDQDRIFQRFERLSGTNTQPGTGLGLYVGRKLAEAVGGRLDVESTVDHGSTFTLTLRAPVRLTAVS